MNRFWTWKCSGLWTIFLPRTCTASSGLAKWTRIVRAALRWQNSAFNGVDSDLLESVESQLDHIFGNSEGVNLQPQAGSVGHNMGNRLPLQQLLDQADSSISSLLELSI